MTDIKLFEKWVKKSLKDHFIFKVYKDFFIVCDGYTGYKISKTKKSYARVIKEQTFQDLKEDFQICERRISKNESPDLKDSFNLGKYADAIKTDMIYDCGKKFRIFVCKNKFIFVNESFLKNQFRGYDIFGISEVNPILFYSKDISYIILPVKLLGFPYEIRRKESEDKDGI